MVVLFNGLFIKSITASGPNVETSTVSLKNGLNIISGPSNTGKTGIVRCILYVLNKYWKTDGEKYFPFAEKYGYKGVSVEFVNDDGYALFTRGIDDKNVNIKSNIPGIKNGFIGISSKKENLNDIILKLIGINKRHQVPKNTKYATQSLTWNGVSSLWYLDEESITQSNPIMLLGQVVQRTAFLSSLLFMITGKEIDIPEGIKDPKISKAKKDAVKSQLKLQLQEIGEKTKELSEALISSPINSIEDKFNNLLEEIKEVEKAVSNQISEIKEVQSNITEINQKVIDATVYISRYDDLKTQYIADIKRLSFIVDGEKAVNSIPENKECPFCHHEITSIEGHSHIDAANAELGRILEQLDGLKKSTDNVTDKRKKLLRQLEYLKEKKDSLNDILRRELKPKLENLTNLKKDYQGYISLKSQLDVYRQMSSDWTNRIIEIEKDSKKIHQYHPKEHFPDNFANDISSYARDILTRCNYGNLNSVIFNLDTFEIEINGNEKSEVNGKGYRSFLNTVVNLSFRRYMALKSVYKTGTVIIDTPFLGLDQGEENNTPDGLKNGLIQYLNNSQNEGQVILIENSDAMPSIDNFKQDNINFIKFTKNKDKGRYGFLLNVPK